MPEGYKKSKTLRKVTVKTPGSNLTTHYRKRKKNHHVCPETGKNLAGVSKITTKKQPKSSKKSARPYANKSPSTSRRTIINKAR